MIKGGRELQGQTLYLPMADRTIAVTVTDTVFIDKEGERLRA
jgi:sarcosine oxidase subunit alpha